MGAGAAVLANVLVSVIRLRRRYRGAYPLPGWALRAEHLGEDGRILVAKVARATLRDAVQEWDELPLGLRTEIQRTVDARIESHLLNEGSETGRHGIRV